MVNKCLISTLILLSFYVSGSQHLEGGDSRTAKDVPRPTVLLRSTGLGVVKNPCSKSI